MDPSHNDTHMSLHTPWHPILAPPCSALSPCITPGSHQTHFPIINFRMNVLLFHSLLHLWLSQHCVNINCWQLIKPGMPIFLWRCCVTNMLAAGLGISSFLWSQTLEGQWAGRGKLVGKREISGERGNQWEKWKLVRKGEIGEKRASPALLPVRKDGWIFLKSCSWFAVPRVCGVWGCLGGTPMGFFVLVVSSKPSRVGGNDPLFSFHS